MENWDALQDVILKILTPPIAKVRARIQLTDIKQGDNEPVIDFVNACKQWWINVMATPMTVLKDALVRGLSDERVSTAVLAESDDMDLPDLIKFATKHDLAV